MRTQTKATAENAPNAAGEEEAVEEEEVEVVKAADDAKQAVFHISVRRRCLSSGCSVRGRGTSLSFS